MGLFSRSETYYNTSTLPLFDDNVAGIVKQSIVSTTTQNSNMASVLRDNLLNSIVVKSEGLYRYAQSGDYPWGLPNHIETSLSPMLRDNIQFVIENEIGTGIEFSYCVQDTIIVPSIVEPSTPNLPTTPPEGWYDRNDTNTKKNQDFYYVVEYRKKDITGELLNTYYKWWFKVSDATEDNYPLLVQEGTRDTPYFPIIPFRINGKRVDNDSTYESSIRRACNYLSLSHSDVGDSVQEMSDNNEVDGDENPIEDAYVFLGCPVGSNQKNSLRYLYEYFYEQYLTNTVREDDYNYWLQNRQDSQVAPMNSVVISDASFRMELGWKYVTHTTRSGQLTDAGGNALRAGAVKRIYTQTADISFGQNITDVMFGGILTFQRQLENGSYDEVEVHGLVYSSTCVGEEIFVGLSDVFNGDEEDLDKFVIPMHKGVIGKLGKVVSHDVLNEAVRLIVNDKVKVKKKGFWLQIVGLIASIALCFINPAAGFSLYAATQIGVNIAVMIIMYALSPVITKAFEDVFGEEWGRYLAMIATLMVGKVTASAVNAASVGKDVGAAVVNTATQGIQLTAMKTIELGLAAIGTVNEVLFNKEMEEITDQLKTVNEELEAITDYLDDMGDELIQETSLAMQYKDTNRIMDVSGFVSNTLDSPKEPTLVTGIPENFVAAMQYTGRVYTPINSARILA